MPKSSIKIQDVFEAFITDVSGVTRFFGCLNTTAISKTVDVEDVRCGIGAKLANLIYSNPDMSVTITPAFLNEFFLEQSTGNSFEESATISVKKKEFVEFADSTGDATATITGTPVNGEVSVQAKDGTLYVATFSTGTVTVTGEGATLAGKKLYVIYDESVTADVLSFEADKYPEVQSLTLRTIAYDVDKNLPVANIYFVFDRVLGDGAMELSATLSTNSVNEVTLRVLPDADGLFGKYITEPIV